MGFHNQSEADTVALMVQQAEVTSRHVELNLSEEEIKELANRCREKFLEALGRLTAYLYHGDYTNVLIYSDREDLTAYYTDRRNDSRRFVMGAVWRPEQRVFTFHS